jgi:hypothetical protein
MSDNMKKLREYDRQAKNRTIWSVITASSLGTLIEWYDFYIFGSLAVVLATKFSRQIILLQHFYLHLPLLLQDLW